MTEMVYFSVICLVLLMLAGAFFCWWLCKRFGFSENIRLFVLINYLIIHPLSGIVHLLGLGASRGYVDLMNYDTSYLLQANLVAFVGLVFLLLGSIKGVERDMFHPVLTGSVRAGRLEIYLLIVLVAAIGPISIYGLFRVNAIANEIGVRRIIALDGGTARFAFLSHWFVWTITFIALILIDKIYTYKWLILGIVFVAITLITLSLSWTGGRSIIIVMSFPLVFYALPFLRQLRGIALSVGMLYFLVFVVIISNMRIAGMSSGHTVDVGNWLDWEWGRYSMIATSLEYIGRNGYLYGESLIASLVSIPSAIFSIAGIDFDMGHLRTSLNMASEVLFGDPAVIYVVPGFTAELYTNFGLLGVAGGYWILGRVACWIDNRLRVRTSAIQRVTLYYIGALLIFRVMPSDSASLISYLIYSGAPLLVASAILAVFARQRRLTRISPVLSSQNG